MEEHPDKDLNSDVLEKKKIFFRKKILHWYAESQRVFPWRYTGNPYYVLVSEVLLQQTNAEKVVEPFNLIINKYPTINSLAEGDIEFLRSIFKDLGLFYRADRLINIAKDIVSRFNGAVPVDRNSLLSIIGIGDYCCNAVICFGNQERCAIVDTNVIRIIERFFNIRSQKSRPRTDKKLWEFVETLLPDAEYQDFNYGILDFSALVCTHYNPKCRICILSSNCSFFTEEN